MGLHLAEAPATSPTLRVRWLGRVPYTEAWALQRAIARRGRDDHLLLLEHPHVYTLGVRTDLANLLTDPASVGAECIRVDRGGDVTYHGPGQLVAYPILTVGSDPGAGRCHVHRVEQVVIDTLVELGLPAAGVGRLDGYPGVWVGVGTPEPRKICAVGVRVSRGRSTHGLALNVDPDLTMFSHIVPCGIADKPVTSLAAEGLAATMAEVVEVLAGRAVAEWGAGRDGGRWERQDVVSGPTTGPVRAAGIGGRPDAPASIPVTLGRRLRQAGVDPSAGLANDARKPPWLRVPARMGEDFLGLRRTLSDLGLVTVCEEAGCPNIFECWADGTATFMINGSRCTRSCAFCLVDTRHPEPLDASEPERVADAVARLGLAHAVVTCVARDDLPDGGAGAFAATIHAVRRRSPGTAVEVLISDMRGDAEALAAVFEARPDVLNHNIETVARLQRAVRPQAGYARSLSVLARAKDAGLTAKSGLIVGMGEEEAEVVATMADLRAVGVDLVTIGQYLRPTAAHLPVARWWAPEELDRLADIGRAMGFSHVQASPLTRSSYHAREAAGAGRRR